VLWLMSCRVFQRELELAVFDHLVARAREDGVRTLVGRHVPTAKNGIVADLYRNLGFEPDGRTDDGTTRWRYRLPEAYETKNRYIKVIHG
ncbi:MAG: hypothetical protein AB7D57_04595, partial [Desulfovibrionaceae bacterium]